MKTIEVSDSMYEKLMEIATELVTPKDLHLKIPREFNLLTEHEVDKLLHETEMRLETIANEINNGNNVIENNINVLLEFLCGLVNNKNGGNE